MIPYRPQPAIAPEPVEVHDEDAEPQLLRGKELEQALQDAGLKVRGTVAEKNEALRRALTV